MTGRGGKGRELLQRGQFTRVIPPEVENPAPATGREPVRALPELSPYVAFDAPRIERTDGLPGAWQRSTKVV